MLTLSFVVTQCMLCIKVFFLSVVFIIVKFMLSMTCEDRVVHGENWLHSYVIMQRLIVDIPLGNGPLV